MIISQLYMIISHFIHQSMFCRLQTTYDMTMASGEGDKLHQGLYDNYLEAKVKDPHLDGVS